ncbi:MAG: formylglycine-generating enzyme family protein [Planctomycetia bacterium]|nr:formylglycine-generating enzyme family protein [Planctomycetia bacterium]
MKSEPELNENKPAKEVFSNAFGIKFLHFTVVNLAVIGLIFLVYLIYANCRPTPEKRIHSIIAGRDSVLGSYLLSLDERIPEKGNELLNVLSTLINEVEDGDLPENYRLANQKFIRALQDWNNIRNHILKLQKEKVKKDDIIRRMIQELRKNEQTLENACNLLFNEDQKYGKTYRMQTLVPHLKSFSRFPGTQSPIEEKDLGTILLIEPGKKPGEKLTFFRNRVSYTFCWCPKGSFLMGSPSTEKKENPDAEKQHKVDMEQGFWMLESEVTQEMWESIMGNNPSGFKGKYLPVEQITWSDCQKFLDKLNRIKNPKLPYKVDLPTEEEWEYACRAGTQTPFSFGKILNGNQANCNGQEPYGTTERGPLLQKTTPVKSYEPNAWGLYDMHGNVWEWCSSSFSSDPEQDAKVPESRRMRMVRGGGWLDCGEYCRASNAWHNPPDAHYDGLGFRLVIRPH